MDMPARHPGWRFYAKRDMAAWHQFIDLEGSNSCGLLTHAHAPCQLEIRGGYPDELACPLVVDRLEKVLTGRWNEVDQAGPKM
jgi:hypothetical protein